MLGATAGALAVGTLSGRSGAQQASGPTVYVGADALYAVGTATGTPEWISDTVDDVLGSVRSACALR